MYARISIAVLMVFVSFMAIKQGIGLLLGNPETIAIFEKTHVERSWSACLGVWTILSAILLLAPDFFNLGNILMAITILILICLKISVRDIKSAVLELPFLFLNLLLIYFQYLLPKQK